MWTATLDFSPRRMLLMKLLARLWPGACFTSWSPLRVQNLPRPSLPASNWVRVRNRLAGVSGNELHLLRGEGDPQIAPAALGTRHLTYPGHEVVGEVIEVGEGVQRLRAGDRVILQYKPNCVSAGMQQLCRSCAAAEYNLCERALLPGHLPIGGGWSEEMLLHEQLLFPVAAELSDEQAVMLEPTAVALHALLRRPPQPGEQVLIVGAGAIGLLTLQLIRALVPQARVSVLARHSFQVEQATRMGAAHIIYPNDSYSGVQSATGAQRYQGMLGNKMLMGGYDVIYDTVGSRRTLHHALRWVRAQGNIVLVGIEPAFMRIDLSPLWFQQIGLLGSHSHGMDCWPMGTKNRQTTFSIVQRLLKEEQIHPEQLITQRFALNNYREALSTAMGKSYSRAIKVVFDYSLLPASVVPNVRASARKPRPAVVSSSAAPRRSVALDAGQNWPDIPMTSLPVPMQEEIEDTMHALPVMPKSPISSQHAQAPAQPSRGDGLRDRQPNTTGAYKVARKEPEPVQPYIAEEDEATVIVRMTDVQAAYKAMEALQSESEGQHQEPLEAALPSTDGWSVQESAEVEGQPADVEVESEAEPVNKEEPQPVHMEFEGGIELAEAEEQFADVEAESGGEREAEAEVVSEEEPQQLAHAGVEEAVEPMIREELPAEGRVSESEEPQQTGEADSEIGADVDVEQSFESEPVADWSEIAQNEEPSQAARRADKGYATRPQTRQRNNSKKNRSRR